MRDVMEPAVLIKMVLWRFPQCFNQQEPFSSHHFLKQREKARNEAKSINLIATNQKIRLRKAKFS